MAVEVVNCINKGLPVCFSYAPNSDEKPEWEHIADCVDTLKQLFDAKNIEYLIDDTPESDTEISEFGKNIGKWNAKVYVLVFSDRYFRSFHCMYEFVQIKKALKNDPSKRLFCIKSGNFNLSDINYILDLEHFWGDQKQEYEESQYFHTREHTEVEQAAFVNGFYMSDIRSLYSFFSTLNYAYANNQNWDGFVNEIINCYTSPSKYLKNLAQFQNEQKSKRRFLGLGCVAWFVLLFLIICVCSIVSAIFSVEVDYPEYTEGTLNEGKLLEISSSPFTETEVILRCYNNENDTFNIYTSRSCYVEANGIKYYLTKVEGVPLYPEYAIIAPYDSIKITYTFPSLPIGIDSINFWESPSLFFNGIKLKEKEDD